MTDTAEHATHTDHRCRRAERCADREKITTSARVCDACDCHNGCHHPCTVPGGCGHLHPETNQYVGKPITTADGLCPLCTTHITQDIRHLKGDAAELTTLIGRNTAPADAKVTSTPEPPTPLRLNIEALRVEIEHETQAWAEPVAEALGINWDTQTMRDSRWGVRVNRAVNLLTAAVDTLLALPLQEHSAWDDGIPIWDDDLDCQDTVWRTGLDAALHLSDLHHRAYSAAGRTRLVHRLPARCPWCWERTLVRDNGADHVHCESGRCRGRPVDEKHYDWLVQATLLVEKAHAAA